MLKFLSSSFSKTASARNWTIGIGRFPSVSIDQTRHVGRRFEPIYEKTFKNVMSFHAPENLASVSELSGVAYHIDLSGNAAYNARFAKAFGYYEKLAAVCDFSGEWFHIDVTGSPAYSSRYAWCGNFTRLSGDSDACAQAPVRSLETNSYHHINEKGVLLGGPYSYAGDPNSSGQSVVWDLNQQCSIVNADGSLWGVEPGHTQNWVNARVPHKGIAAVKDGSGWFFVDHAGAEVGGGRYAAVEPHYNGQARVKSFTGVWSVVNEQGVVSVLLGQPDRKAKSDLVRVAQQYWPSLALRMIIDHKVLESGSRSPSGPSDTKLHEILQSVAVDLGLCTKVPAQQGQTALQLTAKGQLLLPTETTDTTTLDRCRYWLQDRYLTAWQPWLAQAPRTDNSSLQPDTFRDISIDRDAVALSQRVLASYAQEDWKGVCDMLPLHDLLQQRGVAGNPLVVVDLAGGTGSLLRDLSTQMADHSEDLQLTCLERPEVVALASPSSEIDFVVGDLFRGPLPAADVYLMSRVLHDWDDSRALQILARIHQQSAAHATLCVIDRHATEANTHALLSLHMHMLQKAHERTPAEWSKLFSDSGWVKVDQNPFNGHEVVVLKKSHCVVPEKTAELLETTARASTLVTHTAGPRIAVVPIAGLGTRMSPQSLVTPKALLPILTRGSGPHEDTEIRPALSHLLQQLLAADTGIEQVCIVASSHQLFALKSFLSAFEMENLTKTTAAEMQRLLSQSTHGQSFLNGRISVTVQSSALGFGDAILTAKHFVDNEPFLVALGDHVFTPGCVKQMMQAYQSLMNSEVSAREMVGLTGACLCGESEIPLTGLLQLAEVDASGAGGQTAGAVSLVTDMAEKPSEYRHFALPARANQTPQYLSQLGLDILPPSIFAELEKVKAAQTQHGQEVGLRGPMRTLLQLRGHLYSCLVNGTRLDIGTPSVYWNALQTMFHMSSSTKAMVPAVSDGSTQLTALSQTCLDC